MTIFKNIVGTGGIGSGVIYHLEGNHDFRGPAFVGDPRRDIPYTVPVLVQKLGAVKESIESRAVGIDLEKITIPEAVECVNHHSEIVIAFEIDIALHFVTDDRAGIGIEAYDTYIDIIIVIDDADLRPFCGRIAFGQIALCETGRRFRIHPERLGEETVQFHR